MPDSFSNIGLPVDKVLFIVMVYITHWDLIGIPLVAASSTCIIFDHIVLASSGAQNIAILLQVVESTQQRITWWGSIGKEMG